MKVEGCWGNLVGFIRWSYGFQNCGWFWDGVGDWVDFGTREPERLGGGGGEAGALREPMDSNRFLKNCFGDIRNFSVHARFQI